MPPDFDPSVRTLIARQASKLIGQAGFRSQDRRDLEQSLSAIVCSRLRGFDPQRGGLAPFVAKVVQRAAANLIRDRRAARRDCYRTVPLPDVDFPEPDPPGHATAVDCALDVAALLAKLPKDLRVFAERLQFDSFAEATRQAALSRSAALAQARELRRWMTKAGLQKYLPNS